MSEARAICVIPARLHSTRTPKKLLRRIGDKPLIAFTYERAKQSSSLDRVLVATDHEDMKACVEGFGGEALMTSAKHTSGTSRISEAAERVREEIIVNVQGDEPLMHPETIDLVVRALRQDPRVSIASACVAKDDEREFHDPNVVKVVKTTSGDALYFSRAPIPYKRGRAGFQFLKHLGIYAYRRAFLLNFKSLPASALEADESLEQLRFLDHGYAVRMVVTVHDSIGIDTDADVIRLTERLTSKTAGVSDA
jgi:3-deoxy-manno-octulosonate cytidylyltransferase (CMP-KDO synthetase)